MITEVSAAYEGVKAAITIARGLQNLKTEAEVNQAVIEIQRHLLDTQHTVLQLQETIQSLKTKIAELEQFDTSRFELVDVVYEGHKYSGRKAPRDKTTDDYYCPTCFSQRRLTVIQFSSDGTSAYDCGSCDKSIGWANDMF